MAAADIETGDLVAKAEHSNRALDIVSYLQSTLDFENGGEVAGALDIFYITLSAQILNASAKLDSQKMQQAAQLLLPVREAWATQFSAARPAYAVTEARSFASGQQMVA